MKVIYRMTDIPSTNPSPIFQENKYALNKLCLTSFLQAFEGQDIHIHFILDHAPQGKYEKLLQMVTVPFSAEYTQIGINGTMNHSYYTAIGSSESKYVLFQECDYLYRPGTGKQYLEALEGLPEGSVLSPYDHPNFYRDSGLHADVCGIKLIGNHHYRTTERNTMTWGCEVETVKKNYPLLTKYGYLDGDVWYELYKKGHRLFVPIPTFATHMVSEYLSPGYDWSALWQTLETRI
jgi:hypothetical protein